VITYIYFLIYQFLFSFWQFHNVDRKPYTVSTWSDPKQFPPDGVIPQHHLGYFAGTGFEKDEIAEIVQPGELKSTNDRKRSVLEQATPQITPNQRQIFNNSTQSTFTQHFQDPRKYASQYYGFERDGAFPNFLKPNPRARYPPDDPRITRYGMKQSVHSPQAYRQEKKYDKDQYLSSSNSYNQIRTSPRHVISTVPSSSKHLAIPNVESMRSSFTAFSKSNSGSGLYDDQKFAHAAAKNKEERHQRISLQPTRHELKIISGRKQSENINVERPTFQMTQQEFHEPLQSL
jgi:hypothetical protein